MNKFSLLFFLAISLTTFLNGFETTPAFIQVDHERQEETILPFEISTDLPAGTAWSVASNQPFISFVSDSGVSPASIQVRIDQVELGKFVASKVTGSAGTITITASGDEAAISVFLKSYQLSIQGALWSNSPDEFLILNGPFNGATTNVVKFQASTGLVIDNYQVPSGFTTVSQNPQGTKAYLSSSFGLASEIKIVDLETFEDDTTITIPEGSTLRAIGKDFLLLQGGNTTVVNGENIRGKYFTFLSETQAPGTVLDFSAYRTNGLAPAVQRKTGDGDLLMVGQILNGGLLALRIEKDGFVEEFNDFPLPPASGPAPSAVPTPFIDPTGQQLFLSRQSINRTTGEVRNIAFGRQVVDSTRDGRVLLNYQGLGYPDSDKIIPLSTNGTPPEPLVFSSEDRYIFVKNVIFGAKIRFLKTEDFVSLPVPSPSDGSQISSLSPGFSIPPVAGAASYRLTITKLGNGEVSEAMSSSPVISLQEPLARGFRFEWQIDAITPAGTITGSIQTLETIFAPSQTFRGRDIPVAGRTEVAFIDTSGEIALIKQLTENGVGQESESLTLEPSTGTARGREAALAGGKLFVNSGSGVFIYERNSEEIMESAGKVPLPNGADGSGFGFHLASGGDLLFATSVESGTGLPRVEVFRTRPDVIHTASITLPLNPGSRIPFPREIELSASGDTIAVVTPADTDSNQSPSSLFVFNRDDRSLQWSLTNQFDYPSLQSSQSPTVSTDGKYLAMTYRARAGSSSLIFKRLASGTWEEQSGIPPWSTSFPVIKNGVLVTQGSDGLNRLVEGENEWTLEPLIRGTDFGGPLLRRVTSRDSLILATYERLDEFSIFEDVFPATGVPDLAGDPATTVIAGAFYDTVFRKQDRTETVTLLDAPDWLKIETTPDGDYLLTGKSPLSTSRETIIVKAEGTSGLPDFRVFDLEVVEGDLPLQARVKPSFGGNITEGESLYIEAETSGTGDLSLQWFKDGIALEGQTSTRLFIPGADPTDSGEYVLRVTNQQGLVETDPIPIDVIESSLLGRNWTMIGGGPGQRNFSPATLGTSDPILAWSTSGLGSDPVISDGRIYLSGNSSPGSPFQFTTAFSLNLADGSESWQYTPIPNLAFSQPTILGDQVFFTTKLGTSSNSDKVISLNAETGELIWERQPEQPRFALIPPTAPYRPIAHNNRLWINSLSLGVQSWTLNGEERLTYDFPGFFGFALAPNSLYLSSTLGRITGFDPDTAAINIDGNLQSSNDPVFTSSLGSLTVDGSMATIVLTRGVKAFDLRSLETIWSTDPLPHGNAPGSYYRTALTGDHVIAANLTDAAIRDPDDGNFYYPVILEIIDRTNGIRVGSISTRIPGLPGLFSSPKFDLIAFNDSFAFSSGGETTIYDLETLSPLHELPHGGNLIYGEGFLIINDNRSDNQQPGLHAYRINDRPDLLQPQITEALEDQATQFTLQVDHFENEESPTYSLVGEYDWLSLSSGGEVTILPTQEDLGDDDTRIESYTIRVSDGVTRPTEQTFSIKLIAVNDDPVLGLEPVGIAEDSDPIVLPLATFASDEESPVEDLNVEILRDDSGQIATVDLTGSTLTISPLADQFGTFAIELKVTDPEGGETSGELIVTITPVNDPPELVESQVFITADPDGKDQSVPLADSFFDRDPNDELRFAIASQDHTELFESLTINPASGSLSISYAPYISGQASIRIVATDLEREEVSLPVQITLPEPATPTILASGQPGAESKISLNPQTGLFEQTVKITNNAARAIGGFSIAITGLTNGFRLYQNTPNRVIYGEPIEVGASVELTLEYYSATSGQVPEPTLEVVPILPQPQESAETLGVAVDKVTTTGEGAILLEFESEESAEYVIQYSFDMTTWFNSPAIVDGANNRTQWLDQGLPRTPCHPRDCPARFYRVLKVVTSE